MKKEATIWDGTPSQWTNFTYYFMFTFLIPLFGVGLLLIIWQYLLVKTWKIKITSQRIIEQKGVLSKTTDELELFRVKDIRLDQPFWLRLVGLSNIILVTSDKTSSKYIIPAIKNGTKIREEIRAAVDQRRDEKGVRETDFE